MVNLEKGERVNLEKPDGSGLKIIRVGLGWSFNRGASKIDLDASIVCLDENNKLLKTGGFFGGGTDQVCYFGRLEAADGSIVHSGDNLTGEGEGEDESIYIDLEKVPSNIKTLVVTINSFQGHKFSQVSDAFVQITDIAGVPNHQKKKGGTPIFKYNLSDNGGDYTGIIMAKIRRQVFGGWEMQTLNISGQGRGYNSLIPLM